MNKKNDSPRVIRQLLGLLLNRKNRLPGQLIIQYSDACNATCPQCQLRVSSKFPRKKISMNDMKRMIDTAALRGFKSLSFTGGEPFLFDQELIELIRYAGDAGIPYIRTGTNGYMFTGWDKPGWESKINYLADKMAEVPLYTFWISIDSADRGTHEEMRGLKGVIKGIEKALPIFHERGIFPAANLGINRNVGGKDLTGASRFRGGNRMEFYEYYRQAFGTFYETVCGLGFTIVNACYPMSSEHNDSHGLDSVYGAASADDIITFSSEEKTILFAALRDTIPQYRHKLRIFTPLSSLQGLIDQYQGIGTGYPCRGGIDYFFVDAQKQDTYPCGFRGDDNMGKFWDIDFGQLEGAAYCRQCDWECFRDPSELLGPVMDLKTRPFGLFCDAWSNRQKFRLWYQDFSYYRACSFFSGRKKPDYHKLSKFSPENKHRRKKHHSFLSHTPTQNKLIGDNYEG